MTQDAHQLTSGPQVCEECGYGNHVHCANIFKLGVCQCPECERAALASDPLRSAALDVVREWDERGDHGCRIPIQNRLRSALGMVEVE